MPTEPPAVSPRPRLRRLPGRSPTLRLSRATPSARLWIDDRELVQETVSSYTQEIQRFALADIQAIQIRRTVHGVVYNMILGPLLLAVLLLAGLSDDPPKARLIEGASLAAPFALLLLVNALRGPTSRAVLTTALGPQPLPSLSRMRPARRALDVIIANTEAVQGALSPDEAARQLDQPGPAQPTLTPSPAPPPAPPSPGEPY